jgi:hypothetical protein
MGVIIREVGTNPQSWSDAARQAVATASKTVRTSDSRGREVKRRRRGRPDRRISGRGQDRLNTRAEFAGARSHAGPAARASQPIARYPSGTMGRMPRPNRLALVDTLRDGSVSFAPPVLTVRSTIPSPVPTRRDQYEHR